MWNRRKDEELLPKSTSIIPPPQPAASFAREGINMNPAPRIEPESPRGGAAVGKSVFFKGQLTSREDLYIDGEVEGSIEMLEHRLTVGPNGKLLAGIKAREIVVLGTVHGNVEASEKIEIRREARLIGDLKTARIVIEDGAYFKGSIDIVRQEPKKEVRPPAPAPIPVQSTAAAAGAPTGSPTTPQIQSGPDTPRAAAK
jgi:cytoskeletal protein CcmA (bactofilin family)